MLLGTGCCSLTGSAGKDSRVLTLASPVNTQEMYSDSLFIDLSLTGASQ